MVNSGAAVAGVGLASTAVAFGAESAKKMRVAIVGTGIRGLGTYARPITRRYAETAELVGLCDINPGRVEFAKKAIKAECPTYTDFAKMLRETRPDKVVVTTVDATHDEFICKSLEAGCDVITEKPMTTDEFKCRRILETEKKTGRNVIVTFNYRYSPHRAKIKELLMAERVGRITSVDFHWYLNTTHGADYFRRWHRLREKSGTLLVHKATHHFDLLNWWLDTDPAEVFAYGALEFYGRNNQFRNDKCRGCPHAQKCKFFWDITKNRQLYDLYVPHEIHDGYLRDGCVFREDINIYDKMAVQVKYANNVQLSYSLTTYSPYEGYRIAFNGTKGRLEAWIHEAQPWPREKFDRIRVTDNFGGMHLIDVPHASGGHAGGDTLLLDKLFKDPALPDPLKQSAGTRDGAMSIIVGIAARNSIESAKPIKIADLVDIEPQAKRPV